MVLLGWYTPLSPSIRIHLLLCAEAHVESNGCLSLLFWNFTLAFLDAIYAVFTFSKKCVLLYIEMPLE
jgi:hypothetical protein